MVIEIEDSQGFVEWVHRFHLRAVPERPENLKYTPPVPVQSILPEIDDECNIPTDWSEDPDPVATPAVPDEKVPTEPTCAENTENLDPDSSEPLSTVNNQSVPNVSTTNIQQRRRSRIPVRVRKEPARFKDYVRY